MTQTHIHILIEQLGSKPAILEPVTAAPYAPTPIILPALAVPHLQSQAGIAHENPSPSRNVMTIPTYTQLSGPPAPQLIAPLTASQLVLGQPALEAPVPETRQANTDSEVSCEKSVALK
jgi:hypothetical protein